VTFLQQALEIGGALGSLQLFGTFPIVDASRLLLWTHTSGPVRSTRQEGCSPMKKLALPMAAILALLSIAGCAQYVGKGKAPPPVVTKG
jgi:hypothetical protein